jgi:endonuclease G, mitochondrial
MNGPSAARTIPIFLPMNAARAAGLSVARIITVPEGNFAAEGFATGFIVAPGLLMTNQHVFENEAQARGTAAQFQYEYTNDNRLLNGVVFRLEPDRFFVSDRKLDFAVVAVAEQSESGRSLSDFAPILRRRDTIPINTRDAISIIQHPDGGHKRYAVMENLVVDLFDEGFIHYTTDTEPGSSGSPAFAERWMLCALHHCGVPRMEGDNIMLKGGGVWREGMDKNLIDWIANEGIMLSRIFAKLNEKAGSAPPEHRQYYDLLRNVEQIGEPAGGESEPPASGEQPDQNGSGEEQTSEQGRREDEYRSSVTPGLAPVAISVSLSKSNHNSIVITTNVNGVPAAGAAPSAIRPPLLAPERRIRFDPDYDNRRGYDRDFLDERIDFPDVSPARRSEMFRDDDDEIVVLPYHHFSIAMNAERRLAMWTAANIDYNRRVRDDRDRDAFGDDYWIEDPRVPSDLQLKDAEFYAPATKVDRGHLVRRQDNAWGHSPSEIEYGNSDTFHWTNCTPQHERFNRGMSGGVWGAFEEHLVDQIAGFRRRISIFAGPILAADDPSEDFGAGEIQYPVRFWENHCGSRQWSSTGFRVHLRPKSRN